jgi:deoxyribodipyrimidine photo-lyase
MLKAASPPLLPQVAETLASSIGLVWFQQSNLRLHDNQILSLAHQRHQYVIHLFCFEEYYFQSSMTISHSLPTVPWPKTGYHRTKLLIESVQNLQENLSFSNQRLVLRKGEADQVILDLVKECAVTSVYCNSGDTYDEIQTIKTIENRLQEYNPSLEFISLWGNTLYEPQDLPQKFPSSASAFRHHCEKNLKIAPPISLPYHGEKDEGTPNNLLRRRYILRSFPPSVSQSLEWWGHLPTLLELGPPPPHDSTNHQENSDAPSHEKKDHSSKACLLFRGGETAALERLDEYFFQQNCLETYFHTRNGLLGPNYSTKFSPWLALGCLSPRYIVTQISRYEQERVKNKDTYWLILELHFRDYFKFYSLHHQNKLFRLWGPKGSTTAVSSSPPQRWSKDMDLCRKWCEGSTGNPFVDANMRELNETGWMSNRGRQVVASYLTRDMGVDWRLGAMYFESKLIDHDPALNWGNWTYAAGVGSDPREDRYFFIPKQVQQYDPEYRYIHHWLEETRLWSQEKMRIALRRGIRSTSGPGHGSNNSTNQVAISKNHTSRSRSSKEQKVNLRHSETEEIKAQGDMKIGADEAGKAGGGVGVARATAENKKGGGGGGKRRHRYMDEFGR